MSRAAGLPRLSWFAGLTWFAGGSTGAGCAAHPALAGLTAGARCPAYAAISASTARPAATAGTTPATGASGSARPTDAAGMADLARPGVVATHAVRTLGTTGSRAIGLCPCQPLDCPRSPQATLNLGSMGRSGAGRGFDCVGDGGDGPTQQGVHHRGRRVLAGGTMCR